MALKLCSPRNVFELTTWCKNQRWMWKKVPCACMCLRLESQTPAWWKSLFYFSGTAAGLSSWRWCNWKSKSFLSLYIFCICRQSGRTLYCWSTWRLDNVVQQFQGWGRWKQLWHRQLSLLSVAAHCSVFVGWRGKSTKIRVWSSFKMMNNFEYNEAICPVMTSFSLLF